MVKATATVSRMKMVFGQLMIAIAVFDVRLDQEGDQRDTKSNTHEDEEPLMLEQVWHDRGQVVDANDKRTLADFESRKREQAGRDHRVIDQACLQCNGAFAHEFGLFVAIKLDNIGDLMEHVRRRPEEEDCQQQVQIQERQRNNDNRDDDRGADQHRIALRKAFVESSAQEGGHHVRAADGNRNESIDDIAALRHPAHQAGPAVNKPDKAVGRK